MAFAWLGAGFAITCVGLAGCAFQPVSPAPLPPTPEPTPIVVAPEPAPPPAPVLPPTPPPPDPAALADAAARRLLAFNDRLRELGPADLARESARLGDGNDSAATTLELALVLGQTRQPGDLARALALVEPLTRNGAPAAWQPIARLLHSRLLEQRRLEEQTERQGQQLRDQQRRLEQLASQLEALKAIERSLNTRPPTPPVPAASAPGGR